ncbi:MAG: hypothetical protein DHS20C15_27480 [Planctomycetota bacterium]|nr:MAG: hypothetical protein DHS20C15_27480 [Planctomycetota bacterium]
MSLQENYPDPDSREQGWSIPTRIWPDPDKYVPWDVPEIVRASLEEARKCFRAGAFAACAVMCGRTVESICVHYNAPGDSLNKRLAALREREVIDARLFDWSKALWQVRNTGAHPSGEMVQAEDAQDLFNFAHAITEYVFILHSKYE